MLRRAGALTARARERIRTAREHDPHAEWHSDGSTLLDDDDDLAPDDLEDADAADDRPLAAATVDVPDGEAPGIGSSTPPLGSPEPGAPDLDGAVGPGGVSGPPQRCGPESSRQLSDRFRRGQRRRASQPVMEGVPGGLRTAASWSWRLVVVVAAFYALLWLAAYMAVVVVPVLVRLGADYERRGACISTISQFGHSARRPGP